MLVLCVVLEPRARFASPARFARSYLTKGRVRTPGDPGIVHVQWGGGLGPPPLNKGMMLACWQGRTDGQTDG